MKKADIPIQGSRPPIVAILGHVDHGKTTLLDTIRKTNVAGGEHGGITQHIGAYQVTVHSNETSIRGATKGSRGISKSHSGILRQAQDDFSQERKITFIDTPGHEAFAKMRSRGARVADIALLVVAADDSVKPQTKESIEQIKAANVPIIVVINKIDLPSSNPEKVKSDLAKVGVQVEGFGGDVPCQAISAKEGTGVPELLELILLVADMNGLTMDLTSPPEAVVIETRLDKGKGMVATVIVKKGVLRVGTTLFIGQHQVAKIRAMFDEHGIMVNEATVSKPVEILGIIRHPEVGSLLTVTPGKDILKTPVAKAEVSLPDFLKPVADQELQKLSIILKVDASGSLEAILESLDKRVRVIHMGVGDITDADILQAKSSKAIVIGFNVMCPSSVAGLAETEKVVTRIYPIIYELLQELAEVVAGLKEVLQQERELGVGQIIAEFPFDKVRIAGTKVVSGRLARGDTIKLIRNEAEIVRAKIKTLRIGKNEVTKVEAGSECGVLFDRQVDFVLQDGIIAVVV